MCDDSGNAFGPKILILVPEIVYVKNLVTFTKKLKRNIDIFEVNFPKCITYKFFISEKCARKNSNSLDK